MAAGGEVRTDGGGGSADVDRKEMDVAPDLPGGSLVDRAGDGVTSRSGGAPAGGSAAGGGAAASSAGASAACPPDGGPSGAPPPPMEERSQTVARVTGGPDGVPAFGQVAGGSVALSEPMAVTCVDQREKK